MPLAAGTKTYFSFTKGIITEASPLLYPEDSAIDMDNLVINRAGSLQRRLGIDYEASYVLKDTGLAYSLLDTSAIGISEWRNINNMPSLRFGVVQVGTLLWFVDLLETSTSANFMNGGSALTMTGAGKELVNVSSINGLLIVTSSEFDPIYLTYDAASDTVTSAIIPFMVRDLWGVEDNIPVSSRPTALTTSHSYNLLNQGWDADNVTAFFNDASTSGYPSNADVQALGKDADEVFQGSLILKQFFGTTPAAKGRFIIDAFDRGSTRPAQASIYNYDNFEFIGNYDNFQVEGEGGAYSGEYTATSYTSLGFSSVGTDIETGKISVTAAFSGRVFYSGIASSVTGGDSKSPDYTGFVFFSKLVSGGADLGTCYQEADPTSEHISELIATDGGYIVIPDAANIVRLVPTDRSLIVFAENGIWEIAGDTDRGFSATGYQVSRISDIGCTSARAVVNVEGTISYWSAGGIYVLNYDATSGFLRAQNITATTIQSKYDSISSIAKANAAGTFDPATRKITWLYNDGASYTGATYKQSFNRELVFDTLLQAFYTNTVGAVGSTSPYVAASIVMPNFVNSTVNDGVLANGVEVVANGVAVVVPEVVAADSSSYTQYLSIVPNTGGTTKLTFSTYSNSTFDDWNTYGSGTGAPFSSYLETGYEISDNAAVDKQSVYVTFHFNRTETGFEDNGAGLVAANPSGCLVTPKWDFSNHANSGKQGTQFQAYKLGRHYIPTGVGDTFSYGQSVVTTKNKIRGSGKALSIRIDSEAGKDMQLLGWSLPTLVRVAV